MKKTGSRAGFLAGVVVACGMALVAPKAALAHAVLVDSEPEVNGTISGPEVSVHLPRVAGISPDHSNSISSADARPNHFRDMTQSSEEMTR